MAGPLLESVARVQKRQVAFPLQDATGPELLSPPIQKPLETVTGQHICMAIFRTAAFQGRKFKGEADLVCVSSPGAGLLPQEAPTCTPPL